VGEEKTGGFLSLAGRGGSDDFALAGVEKVAVNRRSPVAPRLPEAALVAKRLDCGCLSTALGGTKTGDQYFSGQYAIVRISNSPPSLWMPMKPELMVQSEVSFTNLLLMKEMTLPF